MDLRILGWVAGAVATAFTAKKGYEYYEEEQAKSREIDEWKRNEERKASIEKAEKEVTKFGLSWGERLKSLVIVDSNIWMNPNNDKLFINLEWVLQKLSSCIEMPATQFDEIVNIKTKSVDEEKKGRARLALRRIERFQELALINITSLGYNSNKHAYADPNIISTFEKNLSNDSTMTLISDDRELRIRAGQRLKDKKARDFMATTGKELEDAIREYKNSLSILASLKGK